MKRLVLALSTLAVLLLGVPGQVEAKKTAREKLLAKFAKFGVTDGNDLGRRSKVLCICNEDGDEKNKLGVLWSNGGGPEYISVICGVEWYLPDGSINGWLNCDDFTILSK